MLEYQESRAHQPKTAVIQKGRPSLWPGKTKCPKDMTLQERDELLRVSHPKDQDDPDCPVRYVFRRTSEKEIEWFRSALTRRKPDGTVVVHGFPIFPPEDPVPPGILRMLRSCGELTSAEYERFRA